MKIGTEPAKPKVCTIASAFIENDNGKILVKEVPKRGISMLGGFVKWSEGFPQCLEERIRDEHNIRIKSRRIQTVYQGHAHGGSWITNINVIASCDDQTQKRNCFWMDKHDVLKQDPDRLRTQDIKWAISSAMQNSPGAGLDFITVTEGESKLIDQEEIGRTVASMVIKNPYTGKFLLMRCGRGPQTGKLSLIGGGVELGEGRGSTISRETAEEAGTVPFEVGLVGMYIHYLEKVGHIANLTSMGYQYHEEVNTPPKFTNEVAELVWLSLNEISSMDSDNFRTPDAVLAIRHSEWLATHGGFFDRNLVKKVKYGTQRV